MDSQVNIFLELLIWIVPIIIAISFHEAAHGFVACILGDETALRQGRVTLNPVKHIDLIGTIIIPLVLVFTAPFVFGYAKPVPVNVLRLKNPRRDMICVALAGPLANLLIAIISGVFLYVIVLMPNSASLWLQNMFVVSIQLNIMLMAFNLLPLLPLDGGRVLIAMMPRRYALIFAKTERYGLLALLVVLVFLPIVSDFFDSEINPFAEYFLPVVDWFIMILISLLNLG